MKKDVQLDINPNEVSSVRYVSPEELRKLLKDGEEGLVKITPWFKMICERFLFNWWSDLSKLTIDLDTIHKMT